MTRRPFDTPPARVRQRQRADGSWRIWWEPEAAVRGLGFEAVELDAARLTASRRKADKLNRDVAAARARLAKGAAQGRRVADLADAYLRSPGFAAKRPATQADYRYLIRRIEAKWAGWSVKALTRPVVWEWYETLHRDHGARQAQAVIRMLSVLMSDATRRGWIELNPCLQLRMETPRPRARVATWAEVDALTAAALDMGRPSLALATQLGIYTGQRQTDILAATVGATAGGVWTLTRSKRGNAARIPLHDDVRPLVAAACEGRDPADALVRSETTGEGYLPDNFRHLWIDVRTAAAAAAPTVETLQFRDLRRSFAALSRAAGADPWDIADTLGNQSARDPRLAATYMPAAPQLSARAVEALRRPSDADPT